MTTLTAGDAARQHAADLTEAAEFVDRIEAETGLEFSFASPTQVHYCTFDPVELAVAARAMAPAEKRTDDNYIRVGRRFGDIEVYAYSRRELVCEQVGTETVEVEVTGVIRTETVERPVWDCKPILGAAS